MKVHELINKLSVFDPHSVVALESGDHTCIEVNSVETVLSEPLHDRGYYHFITQKQLSKHSVFVAVLTP